jgi:hypothetical protein
MALTYEPLASTTLATATSEFTFSSIPQTYTDLVLFIKSRTTNEIPFDLRIRPNANSTDAYITQIRGTGASASASLNQTNAWAFYDIPGENTASTIFSSMVIEFFDYATGKNRALSYHGGDPSSFVAIGGGEYQLYTEAISSLRIFMQAGRNFAAGTSATLYGIKKA